MSSYSELIKYEDELKEKHTGILRIMSHVELKKFNQGKYHSKLLKELEQKLPMNNDKTQLIETAQCIVNALEREAASLIKSRARESTSVKKVSALLSDTVIADFDTTLQMNASQGADATDPPDNACDDLSDDDGDNDSGDETENDCGLDTSITQLKQIVTSNNGSTDTYKTSKSKQSDTDQSVCVPTCKIKPTSKKQYDMTRCTLCMVWCHDKCVGLIQLFDLLQIITEPTRVTHSTSTIIDHVYTTKPENIVECFVPHYAISDHYPVCLTRKVNYKFPKVEHITSTYRCFKKFNENAFQSDLANALQNFELNHQSVDDDFNALHTIVSSPELKAHR